MCLRGKLGIEEGCTYSDSDGVVDELEVERRREGAGSVFDDAADEPRGMAGLSSVG